MNSTERKAVAYMHPGERYESNFWGMVEIIEYKSNRHVIVKFVDSGNIYKVSRDNLLKGLVKDVERSKKITQEKYAAEKKMRQETKDRAAVFLEAARKQKAELAQRKKEESKKRADGMARWNQILQDHKCHFSSNGVLLSGTEVADRNGFVYTVIVKKTFNRLTWAICYKDSGNTYWVDEEQAITGNTYDKLSEDAIKAEKLRLKLWNAAKYESERARRIAMASAYQKNNVERTRVRNRNRRALRVGAQGHHTLEEVMTLLNNQQNKCACCKVELTESTRELDHIMPLVLGGTNFVYNLQWLCQFCNSAKSATHPDEWALYSASEEFKKRRLERLSIAVAS